MTCQVTLPLLFLILNLPWPKKLYPHLTIQIIFLKIIFHLVGPLNYWLIVMYDHEVFI